MRIRIRALFFAPVFGLAGLSPGLAAAPVAAMPAPIPAVTDATWLSSANAPPAEDQCVSVGRRCFSPTAIRTSYNIPDYATAAASHFDGAGYTIGIVDSYGSLTVAHDLHVFDQAFGVPPLCGEEGVSCSGPWFKQFSLQGSPSAKPTSGGNSPGQENHEGWSIEVSLDVEWAHAIAPAANILLIHTPTAETLGVQGLPQMMAAEDYVIQHHMVDVISQSFGTGEAAFASVQSLLNLRYAYKDAQSAGVTVLASSGDDGDGSLSKEPVSQGGTVTSYPDVGWPASDPLVTAVGGTYLCTDPVNGSLTYADTTPNVPARCRSAAAATPPQREWGWIDSGGGF